MKTIKIVRINGEFNNGEDCLDYIQPYTGYDFNHWFLVDEAKKTFEKLNFNCLLKQPKYFLPEYKMTKKEMEANAVYNLFDGYKPKIYLFQYEIPLHVWNKKISFAKINGYNEDFNTYISDLSNYNWELLEEKIIEIPKNILKKYELVNP